MSSIDDGQTSRYRFDDLERFQVALGEIKLFRQHLEHAAAAYLNKSRAPHPSGSRTGGFEASHVRVHTLKAPELVFVKGMGMCFRVPYLVGGDRFGEDFVEFDIPASAVLVDAVEDDEEPAGWGHAIDEMLRELSWVTFLPEADRRSFATEVMDTLRTRGFSELAQLLNEWRETAEVWADPNLAPDSSSDACQVTVADLRAAASVLRRHAQDAASPQAMTPWGDPKLDPVPLTQWADEAKGYLGGAWGDYLGLLTPPLVCAVSDALESFADQVENMPGRAWPREDAPLARVARMVLDGAGE